MTTKARSKYHLDAARRAFASGADDVVLPNINFRPGAVSGELMERDDKPGMAAKESLHRYFDLLARARRTLRFSPGEAAVLAQTLRSVGYSPDLVDVLWAIVDRKLDEHPWHDVNKVDRKALVDRLRGLNPWQTVAVLDCVERFWRSPYTENGRIAEGLVALGLARED